MLRYSATLDVPISTARTISAWLQAHRRRHDLRPHQRATTCWEQAIMLLRWLYEATSIATIARDARVSQATGYRYIHEALRVVSAKSPTLIDALRHAKDANNLFVCLDGTLIRTDRVARKNPKNRHDLWYSGKHKAFGGNVQVLTDESGYPLWVSSVSPGSTHDITAAREHVLDAISTVDICVLADKGYIGAGHNVHTPIRGRNLADDEYEYNRRLNGLRAPSERANAMLKQLKALRRVTLCPKTITAIAKTALVVLHLARKILW
ncbi:Transposase DDE domain protein [Corynebacterium felinum]|uniref:DDE Tnp4 domain-containing protein n=2 Tax=Corynebacterium felinum TaxID=131318 RepID=A0ABU2B7C4_9CORY|nr:transposase family protein [Corynebacterium felinum]MDR7353838.1 hypothetical protein [Corynebacterium felinum]MDR7353989.1 hypothetical protein [Corynebacterium felinum]MDR7354411.1 hypothetical protein [Corynebacterium felinum]MDR7354425.1 hypothetical protein [Corynebacterium felinum]MDR7354462.1 hypothetical protein [Corynebacterium felinum]